MYKMKVVLALAVLALFAAVADSSVVPSQDSSESTDVASPLNIDNSDVIDTTSDGSTVISSSSSADPSDVLSLVKNTELSVIPSPLGGRNFAQGNIGPFDRLLDTVNVNIAAIAGLTQTRTVEYRRVAGRGLSAWRAFETRVSNQGVSLTRAGGGTGQQFVVLILTSRPGGPIHYSVEFWGP